MLMPSIFTHDLFDDVFEPFERARNFGNANGLMRTDVKETKDEYELSIDLPGVRKEDLKAELQDGYLTIGATSKSDTRTENDDAHYLRRERFYGSFSRSFYVGEDVKEDEIKARFTDGILTLKIPKKLPEVTAPQSHTIAIEG